MKFLVDENLPRRAAKWLTDKGFDAVHVLDGIGAGADDQAIWALALRETQIVVTRDNDFLRLAGQSNGRVAVIRIGNCTVSALIAWLDENWSAIEVQFASGADVVEAPPRSAT